MLKLKIEIERSLGRPGFVFMLTIWAQPHPDWEIVVYFQFSYISQNFDTNFPSLSAPNAQRHRFHSTIFHSRKYRCWCDSVSYTMFPSWNGYSSFLLSFIIFYSSTVGCWERRFSAQIPLVTDVLYKNVRSFIVFVLQSMLWVLTIPVEIPSLCIFSFGIDSKFSAQPKIQIINSIAHTKLYCLKQANKAAKFNESRESRANSVEVNNHKSRNSLFTIRREEKR